MLLYYPNGIQWSQYMAKVNPSNFPSTFSARLLLGRFRVSRRWSCKETSGDIGDLGNGRNVIGNLWGYQRKLEKSIWESLEIHGNSQTIATGPYQPNMGGILFKKVP